MSQATETVFVAPVELSAAAWEAFVVTSEGNLLGSIDVVQDAVRAAVAVQVRDVQARVEDAGVRSARDQGWCGVFSSTMFKIFPAGPLDGEDWRDSEGVSCNGSRWTDADGYGRDGFDRDGRDRDGFDRSGRDEHGFDRDGLDSEGIHRDSPERFRFDVRGRDRDGFDQYGSMSGRFTRAELESWRAEENRYRFDRYGFDRDGYDREGYNRQTGLNRRGFQPGGYHPASASYYDADGYDVSGYSNRGAPYRDPATA